VDFRWPRDGDVILAIDMNRNVPRRHRSPGPISELEVEAAEVGVTPSSLLFERSVDERRRDGQMVVSENRPHLTWFSQQVVTEWTVQVALQVHSEMRVTISHVIKRQPSAMMITPKHFVNQQQHCHNYWY